MEEWFREVKVLADISLLITFTSIDYAEDVEELLNRIELSD